MKEKETYTSPECEVLEMQCEGVEMQCEGVIADSGPQPYNDPFGGNQY